jgi:beta-glucosidase
VTAHALARAAPPTDCLGVNNNMPRTVPHAPGEGPIAARHVTPEGPVTALGWEIHPPGLLRTLRALRDRWGNPPVMITENGAAIEDVPGPDGAVDDPTREAYLRDHVAAVAQARAGGSDVRGYFVWSLLDNVEWAAGFVPRFGLVAVDPGTMERRVKRSGRWYARLIERNGAPEEER